MLQSLVYISWLAMVVYFLNFAKQQMFLSALTDLFSSLLINRCFYFHVLLIFRVPCARGTQPTSGSHFVTPGVSLHTLWLYFVHILLTCRRCAQIMRDTCAVAAS